MVIYMVYINLKTTNAQQIRQVQSPGSRKPLRALGPTGCPWIVALWSSLRQSMLCNSSYPYLS